MTISKAMRSRLGFLAACVGLVVLAAIALAVPADAAGSATAQAQDKPSNDFCLGCHSQQGMTKTREHDILSLTIDQKPSAQRSQ
jgi:cytochrome c553